MRKISLDGEWNLYFFKQGSKRISSPEMLSGAADCIKARVPGNAELDLMRSGLLPKDIYKGMNIKEVEKFEDYEWWYEKTFDVPKEIEGKDITLLFSGVDCLAEYWLNGEKIGESDNMFIPVELEAGKKLKFGGKNTVAVRLRSVMLEAYEKETPMYSLATGWDMNFESVRIRKAAHSFGWDIMPRALTVGLWRSVNLCIKEEYEFNQLFCYCKELSERNAKLRICYDLKMPASAENCRIEIKGRCKNSEFSAIGKMRFKAGFLETDVEAPELWWPYGYGDANLYDLTACVFKNDVKVAEKNIKIGIRDVRLERTDITDGINGSFCFYINNVPIMCKGSNWVPMDAFHSKDKERYAKALELVKDIGCNILRCWGGNVYEDAEFFDFCDENGIMVWQDFALGCHSYPQDEEFFAKIRYEAESVIKALRDHPSVILWSGDNECDTMTYKISDPNNNKITRDILPSAVYANDVKRPYIESSPYISPAVAKMGDDIFAPEKHLWGPRDYYKSSFYAHSTAHFVSETGYHGCPSKKSIEKFIDKEYIWPIENNEQWTLHSSDQRNNPARVKLMADQIKQLFGFMPETLDEFVYASQVSQAEAKKFFIENIRVNRKTKSGVIWWNLLDGWPQMSDAVVDYYYDKKLAYDYIKRSQQPFAIMCGELADWKVPVVAANDTLSAVCGKYRVTDAETGAELLSGDFSADKNSNLILGRIPLYYSDKGMLIIKWEINGKHFVNHYLYGMPAFSIEDYKRWAEKIR